MGRLFSTTHTTSLHFSFFSYFISFDLNRAFYSPLLPWTMLTRLLSFHCSRVVTEKNTNNVVSFNIYIWNAYSFILVFVFTFGLKEREVEPVSGHSN